MRQIEYFFTIILINLKKHMKQREKKFLKQFTGRSKNSEGATPQRERFVKKRDGDFILIYDNKRKEFLKKEFYAPSGGEIGCNIFLRKLKEKGILAYQENKNNKR
jgi:hypothetical protein